MIGNHRTLLVVALMSATMLLPHEVASFVNQDKQAIELATPGTNAAAPAPGNNVVNPITNTLSNGVGGIGAISEQEADAVLNSMSTKLSNGVGGIGSISEQAADAIFNAVTNRPAKGTNPILTATQPTTPALDMPADYGAGGQQAVLPGLILSIVAGLVALLAGGLLRRRATH